ncbi:MAG: hypothetical protein AAF694_04390 [Bacteroidota bacterium]
MNRFLGIFLIYLLFSLPLLAQFPQGITYQAVIRDGEGRERINESVVLGLAILRGSPTGEQVYAEIHQTATNASGLVNLIVGRGSATQGIFSSIDWGAGPYFIEVSLDGLEIGTMQLLSVPYAFHAQTVEKVELEYSEIRSAPSKVSDFINDAEFITKDELADDDPRNELQTLEYERSSGKLSLLNGNTVDLSPEVIAPISQSLILENVPDLDTIPTNFGSLELDCPSDGVVLLSLNLSFLTFGGRTEGAFGIGTGSGRYNLRRSLMGVLNGAGTDLFRRRYAGAATVFVPVKKGVNTFYATGEKSKGFGESVIRVVGIYFSGMFLPFPNSMP